MPAVILSMVRASYRSALIMIILSDAQAETVCGGHSGPAASGSVRSPRFSPRTFAIERRSVPAPISRQLGGCNCSPLGGGNAINLLVAPLINLSFVIAVNGGSAIGSDQNNTLNAVLA